MASKKEVLHHVFHGQLLQVDVALSLCTFKLVDKECWEKKVLPSAGQWDGGEQGLDIALSARKSLAQYTETASRVPLIHLKRIAWPSPRTCH